MRRHATPPPELYADEPVLFETGPHWVSQDTTLGLLGLVLLWITVSIAVDLSLLRFVIIPLVPLLIRLALDLPRYWRFETVLTTRRLIVNAGMMRDVYHTIRLKDIGSVEMSRNTLGRLLGFGVVTLDLEAVDPDGRHHTGTYVLDYVRDPVGLRDAIVDAMATL